MFSALIIDADEAANASIRSALAPFGFEFTATQDASEAMSLAKTATPDIIFLRVELPNVSGFSVCNKLRRNDDTRYIPLVMYASDVSSDVFDQHRNLKTHADDYLKLPFGQDELVASVGGLMSLPEAGSAPEASAPPPEPDPVPELEVEVEATPEEDTPEEDKPEEDKPAEPSSRLEMAEFDEEFAEMEDAPAKSDPDIADEMEMAFDGLLDEPAPADVPADVPAEAAPKPQSRPAVAARPTPAPARERPTTPTPRPSPRPPSRPMTAAPRPTSAPEPEATSEPDADAGASSGDFKSQREVIQLKSQLNAKQREILALKDEVESAERSVLDAKHKNRELQVQIGELEERLLGAEENIITAKEQADAANRDKNTVLKREEGLKVRLEGTQKKAKDLETQLAEARQQATEAQESGQRKIAALHRELESAETDLATARQELDDIKQELDGSQARAVELANALQEQTTKAGELGERVSALEAEGTQLREELEATRKADAEELERRLAEAAEAAANDKASTIAAQTKEHQAEVEFEEGQHRLELERMRSESAEIEAGLRAQLDDTRGQLERSQSAAQQHKRADEERIADLDEELSGTQEALRTTTGERDDLRERLERALAELESRRSNELRAQQAIAVALRVLDGQTTTA